MGLLDELNQMGQVIGSDDPPKMKKEEANKELAGAVVKKIEFTEKGNVAISFKNRKFHIVVCGTYSNGTVDIYKISIWPPTAKTNLSMYCSAERYLEDKVKQ